MFILCRKWSNSVPLWRWTVVFNSIFTHEVLFLKLNSRKSWDLIINSHNSIFNIQLSHNSLYVVYVCSNSENCFQNFIKLQLRAYLLAFLDFLFFNVWLSVLTEDTVIIIRYLKEKNWNWFIFKKQNWNWFWYCILVSTRFWFYILLNFSRSLITSTWSWCIKCNINTSRKKN